MAGAVVVLLQEQAMVGVAAGRYSPAGDAPSNVVSMAHETSRWLAVFPLVQTLSIDILSVYAILDT
jgi:hypothetical protein